jgi:hypothetical protein
MGTHSLSPCSLEVYSLLDEMIVAGELCESSLKQILCLLELQKSRESLENLDMLELVQFSSAPKEKGIINPKAHGI